MSRTYRALAIVAVVVTATSLVADFTYDPGRVGGWYSYAPLTLSWATLYPIILMGAWLTTVSIAPPVIGTFGAVVAAQGRHWVWLGVFIALGLFGLYGPSALSLSAIELGLLLRLPPDRLGNGLPISIVTLALPAVAALLFVATTSRPARITSGHANP